MDTFETATLIWVCLAQALTVLLAAGFIVGVMLHERSEGYVGAHRPDRGMVSTWQSRGRVFQGYETRIDVDDQAYRLDDDVEERLDGQSMSRIGKDHPGRGDRSLALPGSDMNGAVVVWLAL